MGPSPNRRCTSLLAVAQGMTAYRKRPHDPAQLAKLTIGIASGNAREHAQLKKVNRRKTRTKRPKSP